MTGPRSCVGKDGKFIVGIHKPAFYVQNLRTNDYIEPLGELENGTIIDNHANFPPKDLHEPGADFIYEIANAFAFRGTTYINSAWADAKAACPDTIRIPKPEPCSLIQNFQTSSENRKLTFKEKTNLLDILPHPLLVALAQASTDPEELTLLAKKACTILIDPDSKTPTGIGFTTNRHQAVVPDIVDHELFEVLVNNPCLPDDYKNALVLKPGVQGHNEITGEYLSQDGNTHVFEYLRRNSYIPWGHFAANMANDAIRYSAKELSMDDMTGIRHLYYQRAYIRMARSLKIPCPDKRQTLTQTQLETLRTHLIETLTTSDQPAPVFDATLWGWNFGFGYAQSGHRLHASHQMIHHQNAMIPRQVPTTAGDTIDSFACGDLIRDFTDLYKTAHGKDFFDCYLTAITNNTRTDGNKTGPCSLIVAEDEHTLLFVPKAQVCEFELQLMPKTDCGNIFEADIKMRQSLDKAILLAVKTLESLGAGLITSIEYSKRFGRVENHQHLLYSFIPKLAYAPGTFSEAQLRWISGVYPEDFAHACRMAMPNLKSELTPNH
ncbi:MAG: hypothetical protein ABIJ31_13155 [Pseudomonadota bacterium]